MELTLGPVKRMVLQPIDAARRYSLRDLRGDVVAGLTVSVVAVPQSMAYADIAGVPLQYGLYTVIIQCLIGSLFNSQKFLSVGPINTQSLLVFATVAAIVDRGDPMFLQLVIAMTLLKGLMQMGLAALRLGALVRYVSASVIVGFTAGAGVLIAAKQLKNFFSIEPIKFSEPAQALPGLIGILRGVVPALDQVHWPSVVLGTVALVIVVGAKYVHKLFPGPLLAVAVAAVAVAVMDLKPINPATGEGDLYLVGELPRTLAGFALPVIPWEHLRALLSGALALSLLGLMEAYSIGKTIASRSGQRISANQELLSQGVTNFLSSFLSCIPGSGSFSRSALNYHAGARTLYAGVFNAAFVALIFFAFAPLATYIPLTALAAILFVIAWGLIDWRAFRRMLRSSRADAWVCLATFIATLTIPLEYAVFAGIILNIALYMKRASRLHVNEMVRARGGPFVERPLTDATGEKSVVFLSLEGDLFFGVADELQERLAEVEQSGVRVVILRLKRTHLVDATVLGVLDSFALAMQERGGHVVLCGVSEPMQRVMAGFGLTQTIGEDNIFAQRFGVFASAKAAVRRARELVGHSIDIDDLLDDDEDDDAPRRPIDGAWTYHI